MNYLAHIFLSGNNRQLQVGNFIGDFVKGSQHNKFPPTIQKGIILHRLIDTYTDTHPVFRETVELLRPTFGRYSGILADMYFDYFLASDFHVYSPKKKLNHFAYKFYFSALCYYRWLPAKVRSFITHFITTNRLTEYANYEGLYTTFSIMSRFKSAAIDPDLSLLFLKENEKELRAYFHAFMPDIIDYVAETIRESA